MGMRVERQLWFWAGGARRPRRSPSPLLRDILLPFVAAIVGAYFLNPIADRLQALRREADLGRDPHRRRRGRAA